MVVVAVAGGTGNVGRTIVEVLKSNPEHTVIVLARKAPSTADSSAPVLAIDYTDISGTSTLLTSHSVHTVISALMVMDPDSSTAQVNLVKAAAASGCVRRFITSEWGLEHRPESQLYPLREAAVVALRDTQLEWTRFSNGYFLDYYGMPHVKSYLAPMSMVLDIANKAAAIPGSGDETVAFTYTFDVARFVEACLGLKEWEESTYCYGDKSTWNEMTKMAEEARGCKFAVAYDPMDKLEKGEITELPSHTHSYPFFPKPMLQGVFAMFSRWMIAGYFDIPSEKALNAKFPEIQTMKVKEMIGLWKGS